jgi:hypothetical protein
MRGSLYIDIDIDGNYQSRTTCLVSVHVNMHNTEAYIALRSIECDSWLVLHRPPLQRRMALLTI